MRNRAKCKLCESIIESFHNHDYVTCKCGEISIDGGLDYYKASAKDFNNFLRVDDEGNEIIVKVQENNSKPTKTELLNMLDEMIKNIENLPVQAMTSYITHYDFCASLLLLSAILRSEVKD